LTVRLLVTRPEPDAERTAAALRARGHEVVIAPLLRIEAIEDAEIGSGPWAAILVTSANAAPAVVQHERFAELRSLPAFAVGERSAQAMRAAGFADVTSADGKVADLARLVAQRSRPGAPLLYLAGANRSGDLAGDLSAHGFMVRATVIYRAVAVAVLPRGGGCLGRRHRRRVAFFAPQRRNVCERSARRRPARKRVEAHSFLSFRPGGGTARASRRRRHPHRATAGRGRHDRAHSLALSRVILSLVRGRSDVLPQFFPRTMPWRRAGRENRIGRLALESA